MKSTFSNCIASFCYINSVCTPKLFKGRPIVGVPGLQSLRYQHFKTKSGKPRFMAVPVLPSSNPLVGEGQHYMGAPLSCKKCKIKQFCINLHSGCKAIFSSLYINLLLTATESKFRDLKVSKNSDLWHTLCEPK